MLTRLLVPAFSVFLIGCASLVPATDASTTDASTTDANVPNDAPAIEPDANVICTVTARPTGTCDPDRGICCVDSICLRGICRAAGWMCSGENEYCVNREDCCNSRHSCRENLCVY